VACAILGIATLQLLVAFQTHLYQHALCDKLLTSRSERIRKHQKETATTLKKEDFFGL